MTRQHEVKERGRPIAGEDARERLQSGLPAAERHRAPGRGVLVSVSAAGAEHLRKHRESSPR